MNIQSMKLRLNLLQTSETKEISELIRYRENILLSDFIGTELLFTYPRTYFHRLGRGVFCDTSLSRTMVVIAG